jgi:hypothetical protein
VFPINPEKLEAFESLTLDKSSHPNFESGHCAMEVVAWLADEGHTDAPQCASPVLARYIIRLNDRWSNEKRQLLKPYLIRTIGTGSDGKDQVRMRIAHKHLLSILPDMLRLAGMDDEIAALEAVEPGNTAQLRKTLYAVREAAWAKRGAALANRRAKIRAAVEEELTKRNVAAAVAAAAAAAAADAAADADAVAVAVAAAAADADADAVAAAAADAAAAAAAAAAADAVAVAAAAADFSYGTEAYWNVRRAAYAAARKAYDESEIVAKIRAIADGADTGALALLDRLIDANEEN